MQNKMIIVHVLFDIYMYYFLNKIRKFVRKDIKKGLDQKLEIHGIVRSRVHAN